MSEKAKLGATLVAAGLIDEFQLRAALGEQARWGNRLGETLVRMGYLAEADLVQTLSRHYGIPGVHLEGKEIAPEVLGLLPADVAESYRCIPLFKKRLGAGETLYLGMADPSDLRVIDDVSFRTGLPVRPVLVGPVQIHAAVAAFYRGEGPHPILRGQGASALDETPISPDDTAPDFTELQEMLSEPLGDAELGLDHNQGEAKGRGVQNDATAAPRLRPFDKPRDVPTREILRALTRLLLQKGIIDREELLECIAATRKRSSH